MTRLVFARRSNAAEYLLHFFVSSVAAILFTRVFLTFTQDFALTSGQLHIAHVLYGGLFLTLALLIVIGYVGQTALYLSSVLGGIGFGLFLDEVGKFITKDNNYFYQPAAVIIYLVCMGIYLFARMVEKQERAINPANVHEFGILLRAHRFVSAQYRKLVITSWFHLVLRAVFLAYFLSVLLYSGYVGIGLVMRVFGKTQPQALLRFYNDNARIIYSSVGLFVSDFIAAVCIGIAIVKRRNSRLAAYRWFERATLVWIFFSQVFMFYQDQFSAAFYLFGSLLLFGAVKFMQEEELVAAQ